MTMNPSQVHHRFIEPLDVLFLRGNKLFGAPGSYGESLVPPWPSVGAGALRSAMLARDGVDLAAYAQGQVRHPTLGTPTEPGSFTLTQFTLARKIDRTRVETLHALPADLVAEADAKGQPARLQRIQPTPPAPGLTSSAPLAQWPVLPQAERGKPLNGIWLTQAGWETYLTGQLPSVDQLVPSQQLWTLDERVGVGLDSTLRSAADGQLFSVQAVALRPGVGFLASVIGAEPTTDGVLRFGGDGRGAANQTAAYQPSAVNLASLAQARRARIVLTTPGLFAGSWQLPGTSAEQRIEWPGLSARLVCAAVARADVVSGWDLAQHSPKPAEQAAPAGSVYWLDDLDTTPEALCKLAELGLWLGQHNNAQRRAEGFNRFTFAAW